jgi:hypothetical protein
LKKIMFASSRVLHAILDHMLQLLPEEPANSKRLDDIVDADASAPSAALPESGVPGSGVQAKGGASKMRAAS